MTGHDPAQYGDCGCDSSAPISVAHGHEQRRQRKRDQRIEAEDQRDRGGGLRTERGDRQAWPHIADIAVRTRQSDNGRLPHPAARDGQPDQKGQRESGESAERRRQGELEPAPLLQQGRGENPVKQRREREIDDKNVHPGEARVGMLLSLPKASPRKISPKNGSARSRTASICLIGVRGAFTARRLENNHRNAWRTAQLPLLSAHGKAPLFRSMSPTPARLPRGRPSPATQSAFDLA